MRTCRCPAPSSSRPRRPSADSPDRVASDDSAPSGPATVAVGEFDSARPSTVHTAPAASQASPPLSVTVTSCRVSGATRSRHRPASTFQTRLMLPFLTVNEAADGAFAVAPSGSLKRRSNQNAVPSCRAGACSNAAVSCTSPPSSFRMVPIPTPFSMTAPFGLESTSRNVSPLSSTSSSRICTRTSWERWYGPNVSVPVFAV